MEHLSLRPDAWERTARAVSELRFGMPIVLKSVESRALVAAAESISAARFQALRDIGPAHIAITSRRAEVVKAMVYDGDLARLRIPGDVGHSWLKGMADPSLDLSHPMKGPFQALRDGDASLDRASISLIKQAHLLPTAVIVPIGPKNSIPDLIELDVSDISSHQDMLSHVAAARVPLAVSKDTRVHVFGHGSDFAEHYAIEIGNPSREAPVLSRLHSACFTGDILGSLKCDCGAQLNTALDHIAHEGCGVLLYLNQEGRGIGLANKLRAYALQDQGFDTVEANHRLGFEDDERDFMIGASILKQMGFKETRLMTNNPAKVTKMNDAGVIVTERVPHRYGETKENSDYLKTKARKSGHIL